MSLKIACPGCRASFTVADDMMGKKVRCTSCKEIFVVAESYRAEDRTGLLAERPVRNAPPTLPIARLRADEADQESPRDFRKKRDSGPRTKPFPTTLVVCGGLGLLLTIVGIVFAAIHFTSKNEPPLSSSGAQAVVNKPGDAGAPPGPVPVQPGDGAVPLPAALPQTVRYRWQGGPYLYAVRIEADKDDALDVHQGTCFIDAHKSVRPRGPAAAEERKASGTGFVVNADGYLITCAHVVADAIKTEVVLGGKTYPATVLAVDHEHDLALIRIAGRNLPALPLANSDAAEIGMEVRPFGFPLSDVLGDSLKVTRGTLSGLNREKGHKVFQIDASINPGNSGGPLMTETGAVLGVTIAKLFGEAVSNVGFATPSKDIENLLTGKNVAFTREGGAARLDGPTLVKHVSPAVALIKVTLGEDLDADTYALTCRGRLVERREPKAGGAALPGFPLTPFNPAGMASTQIEIDGRGHLVKAPVGSNQLPFLLGDLGMFLIETLPPDTRPTWETSGDCTITEGTSGAQGRPPFGMPHLPHMPRGPRGFPNQFQPGNPFTGLPSNLNPTPTTHKAKERTVYTRGAVTATTVTIKKHYELTSDNGLTLIGDGQITFDLKTGTPRASEFQAMLTVKKGNTTNRMPLSVRYTLLEGAERDRLLNPAKVEAPKPVVPVQPVVVPRAETTAGGWTTDLTKMKAPEHPAAGTMLSGDFKVEAARLDANGTLVLSQGREAIPDVVVYIFLRIQKGESAAGKSFVIDTVTGAGVHRPAVHFKRKPPGEKLPRGNAIINGYAMRLEFGQARDGKLPGQIYLCLPDAGKSFVAGTFVVDVK